MLQHENYTIEKIVIYLGKSTAIFKDKRNDHILEIEHTCDIVDYESMKDLQGLTP